jgi:hypothetical protein
MVALPTALLLVVAVAGAPLEATMEQKVQILYLIPSHLLAVDMVVREETNQEVLAVLAVAEDILIHPHQQEEQETRRQLLRHKETMVVLVL